MARLSELTDSYYDPMGNAQPALPVEQPFVNNLKRVVITGEPEPELPVTFSEAPDLSRSSPLSNNVDKILNALFRDDEKRLQLWPEKLLRAGATAAGDVAAGKVPLWSIDNETGDVHTSPQMIEKAQEISALAGSGGLANPAKGATLNATPSLRPALRHKEKLYKGKPGQEHQDIIPDTLYNDFQKKAMRGDDLAEYNFGFVNDKGHFLSREDALKYGIDNGIIDPQAGKYGALTSTLMADSSKPGTAIEAVAKSAQPFFSAVEHTVNSIPQTKMNGEAWLGTLSNKPGVKPEELQWTGLQDFLLENKGKPVTKEAIQEHLAANKVELKEVSKGAEELKIQPSKDYDGEFDVVDAKGKTRFTGSDEAEAKAYIAEEKELGGRNPTKYDGYQLPGGENYREVLMTLPPTKNTLNQFKVINEHGQVESTWTDKAKAEAWAAKNNYKVREDAPITLNGGYKSSHWDEPNILAHVRMNDRTIDGKKSLHLEEIQSDWHQQGRDKGYRPEQEKKLAGLVEQREALQKEASTLGASDARYKEIYKELPTIQTKINEIGSSNVGVPDAPFKKSWHELALKRMIREASEKGYDRLSWTPGEAQAARYDLSKQIDDLKVVRSVDGSGYTIDGTLKGRSDRTRLGENIPEDKLADTVGKEMAQKIKKDIDDAQYNRWGVKNKASGNWSQRFKSKAEAEEYQKTLPESIRGKTDVLEMTPKYAAEYSGLDLKVGGEGMKGFYDQIIPKALEKLGKEHGVKVQKGSVGKDLDKQAQAVYGENYADLPAASQARVRDMKAGTHPVYYIDIPQSLRDTATQKGFPLFSKGGYMLMPVDYEPEFKK